MVEKIPSPVPLLFLLRWWPMYPRDLVWLWKIGASENMVKVFFTRMNEAFDADFIISSALELHMLSGKYSKMVRSDESGRERSNDLFRHYAWSLKRWQRGFARLFSRFIMWEKRCLIYFCMFLRSQWHLINTHRIPQ